MRERIDLLVQQIFQKNVQDCSVEEVQRLASDFPFFAPAQLLLVKKLRKDESRHERQLQKTGLYFSDPSLLNQLLYQQEYETVLTGTVQLEEPEVVLPTSDETESEPLEVENSFEEIKEIEKVKPEPTELIESFTSPIEEPEELDDEEENETDVPLPQISVHLPEAEEHKKQSLPSDSLAFEPYHTVDYFASQGINISKNESKDRMDKQLKSFTEWLKTMKRLPVTEQIKTLDLPSERKVEHLAAHSLEDATVYTETMAEVWLKQGNKEKALEIYNKLSLLNPSKRAYFAAKIDSLKKAT